MSVRAIAFDLDDTLLRDDRTLSPFTLRTLRDASERGIAMLPASGRTFMSMRGFVQQIGCARYVISANGAVICAPDGTVLHQVMLDVPLARAVARFARERGVYCQSYRDDAFFFDRPGRHAEEYAAASALRGVLVENLENFLIQPTAKLLMIAEPARITTLMEEAQAAFGEKTALTCSKPYFLEVNPAGASKGQALRWCAKQMGIAMADCAAFGDSLNDVSMLKAAGVGVAMKNARPDVLAMGFEVCPANQEDGVARYIAEHFLL